MWRKKLFTISCRKSKIKCQPDVFVIVGVLNAKLASKNKGLEDIIGGQGCETINNNDTKLLPGKSAYDRR